MMNKRMGTAVAVIALIGLAFGITVAQPRHRGPRKHDPKTAEVFKGLHEAMKTWATSNVLPQLRDWKSDLDGAMSSEDLRTLNDLRARATSLRKEKAAIMAEIGKARQSENTEAAKAAREKMQALREQKKAIHEELKPLAARYRSTLETIGEEARPKLKTWKDEARTIAMKWFEENKANLGEEHAGRMGRGMKGFGHFGGGKLMKHGVVARFMLWDGGNILDQMDEMTNPDGDAPQLR